MNYWPAVGGLRHSPGDPWVADNQVNKRLATKFVQVMIARRQRQRISIHAGTGAKWTPFGQYFYQLIAAQWRHIDRLMQERRNSSALAVELRLSCTNPSIWWCRPEPILVQVMALRHQAITWTNVNLSSNGPCVCASVVFDAVDEPLTPRIVIHLYAYIKKMAYGL